MQLEKNSIVAGKRHTYRIKEVLGQGGFGITYLASSREGGVVFMYALKEHFIKESCDREKDGGVTCSKGAMEYFERSKQDFVNEAKRLEQLREKNRNIVRVEEAFESNNTAYFAMEYLDGDNLMKKVLHEGVMSEGEMMGVMEPIIRAVEFLHENRMLHLDIKPDNVVMRLEDDGRETPVLIDFGVSMHFDPEGQPTTSSRFVGGTRGYAPLEQAQGIDTFSPWVDVYALGATMYFLLTGEAPEKASYKTYVRVGEKLREAGVSERVRKAIVHAMQPNPMDRTGCAAQLLKELKEWAVEKGEKGKVEENDGKADGKKGKADGKKEEPTVGSKTIRIEDKTIKKEKTMKNQRGGEKDEEPKPTPKREWKKLLEVIVGLAVMAGMILIFSWISNAITKEDEVVDTIFDEPEMEPESFNVNGVDFTMVYVKGGSFMMGAQKDNRNKPNYDSLASDYEKPVHKVTLSNYYIGETEVTQALWKAVMGYNPSYVYWKGDNLPVDGVTWDEVQEFIRKLNLLTGRTFRLPTEAEWEYAARGGSKSRGYRYSGSNSLDSVAWYRYNSGGKTHTVKGKQANELGLYDMSGNVSEWCSDWYGDYSSGSHSDPVGPFTGSYRVIRDVDSGIYAGRVFQRSYSVTDCHRVGDGFRLVLCP